MFLKVLKEIFPTVVIVHHIATIILIELEVPTVIFLLWCWWFIVYGFYVFDVAVVIFVVDVVIYELFVSDLDLLRGLDLGIEVGLLFVWELTTLWLDLFDVGKRDALLVVDWLLLLLELLLCVLFLLLLIHRLLLRLVDLWLDRVLLLAESWLMIVIIISPTATAIIMMIKHSTVTSALDKVSIERVLTSQCHVVVVGETITYTVHSTTIIIDALVVVVVIFRVCVEVGH